MSCCLLCLCGLIGLFAPRLFQHSPHYFPIFSNHKNTTKINKNRILFNQLFGEQWRPITDVTPSPNWNTDLPNPVDQNYHQPNIPPPRSRLLPQYFPRPSLVKLHI